MLKYLTFYIILIICTIIIPVLLPAQFSWKLNTEGGYFTSEGSAFKDRNDLLLQFDGDLRYLYSFGTKSLSFELRLRPEFYGYDHPFKVIKFRGEGNYMQKGNKYEWGLHLVNHRYSYSGESFEQVYNTFFMQTHLQWFSNPGRFFYLSAAYAFQNTDFQRDLDLDLFFLEGTGYIIPIKYMRYGLGIYVERFLIRYNMVYNDVFEKNSNSGWRIGPSLTFNYLKDFFVKLDYRFLLHFSQMTTFPSYEQRVRLVSGVIFFTRWSFFLFVDYYTRHFNHNEADKDRLSVFYTPINLENRVYLKLSYDLVKNVEIYIKYGYFKENLIYYTQDLAGLSGVIGFEIRK